MNQLNLGCWLIIAQLGLIGNRTIAKIVRDTTITKDSVVTRIFSK